MSPPQIDASPSQLQIVMNMAPPWRKQGPPTAGPNYISQDKDDVTQLGYNTRSRGTSIMQEAMLACINISKPKFNISTTKLATHNFRWHGFCKTVNLVLGKKGKLLEYRHLIANPKTRATWTHLYRNEIKQLTQGMPGRCKGTDTIFFIPRDKVQQDRAKDIMYGLITCLVCPEKLDKPNRTRLVAGGDRVHYPFDTSTPTADLLTLNYYPTAWSQRWVQTFSPWTSRISTCVHPWWSKSMYAWNYLTCQKMSSSIINCSTSQPQAGTFHAKFGRACMIFPKQGLLPKNFWPKDWKNTDTPRAKPCLGCGSTSGSLFSFPL